MNNEQYGDGWYPEVEAFLNSNQKLKLKLCFCFEFNKMIEFF